MQTKLNSLGCVDVQQLHCRPSDIGEPLDKTNPNSEVVLPDVVSRIEQPRDLASCRVDAGQVWPFVSIAVVASQSKIGLVITPAVLPCDDVLNMECDSVVLLQDSAILATAVGSNTYSCSRFSVHASPASYLLG